MRSAVSLVYNICIILVQEKKCENDEDCDNMFRQTCNVESGICFESDGKRGLHILGEGAQKSNNILVPHAME